jgi:hypothetical protein
VNSELRHAYRITLDAGARARGRVRIVKLIGPLIYARQTVVEDRIETFGSLDHEPAVESALRSI